jgi:hypothetical protein
MASVLSEKKNKNFVAVIYSFRGEYLVLLDFPFIAGHEKE